MYPAHPGGKLREEKVDPYAAQRVFWYFKHAAEGGRRQLSMRLRGKWAETGIAPIASNRHSFGNRGAMGKMPRRQRGNYGIIKSLRFLSMSRTACPRPRRGPIGEANSRTMGHYGQAIGRPPPEPHYPGTCPNKTTVKEFLTQINAEL